MATGWKMQMSLVNMLNIQYLNMLNMQYSICQHAQYVQLQKHWRNICVKGLALTRAIYIPDIFFHNRILGQEIFPLKSV